MRPENKVRVSLADIASELGCANLPDGIVTGVSADNRTIQPGDLFIASRGRTVHAASFACSAIAAGAAAILTDAQGAELINNEMLGAEAPVSVPLLVVEDPAAVAGQVASHVYGNPAAQLTTFGVTGTNGKTSTVYMIDYLLRQLGRRTGLIGTVSVTIGGEAVPAALTTPQPVDLQGMLGVLVERSGSDLVMEVSSHALDQKRTDPLRFDVVGFTNLTQDHLDYHETLNEYFNAKASLFDPQRSVRGVVIVDDDAGARLYEEAAERRPGAIVSLSLSGRAADWTVSYDDQQFTVEGSRGVLTTHTDLPGHFNVANAALALVMVIESGVDPDVLAEAIAQGGVSPVIPGRMEVVSERPYVVVDFAHNTDALEKAMLAVKCVRPGRLIVVTGSAGDRDRGKRPMMARAVADHADHLIVTDDDPHSEDPAQIRREVIAGIPEGFSWQEIADRAEAIRTAIRDAHEEDVVLVAGRGHETIQDVAGEAIEIDDRMVAREALGMAEET
ncbi:UDP-N-acetylmuramoyl-L-alanyl-D-glutamate--2,6-diaminopimelate ligase [Trueperella bonasi]|uniref:UDP-N-acetylmuramyl-tripeptide synthetase n=1 Tax=Trueperella bonasi TaxID=312286 RepID=A0ABT9NI08_9ACTO|nr:UDP-N-acetylmuramoyl-L-alanyl-D-glutamate--2,6-diaminopimelate ligase [Trueperella bonasi]MDP9807010.1 UDP-N-acetylmuramoyl-L-alanyl-D-glutamate--2,6-diaminopimelate ligase [Trueperella bonasi]